MDGRAGTARPQRRSSPSRRPRISAARRSISIRRPETLDQTILATVGAAIAVGGSVRRRRSNRDQGPHRRRDASPAEIALTHGLDALEPGTVTAQFTGSAGQSFGAFAVGGMRLILEGEANDYVGKGMAGGEIAIMPPRTAPFTTPQVIAGNTILYGATGGSLFVAGKAGERFAVRNSGATAVVEGVGDHGCEYMTGGTVVVLGPTGRNFGAGMTNGLAFVVDEQEQFWGRANEDVVLERAITRRPRAGRDARPDRAAHRPDPISPRQTPARQLAETVTQTWKVIPAARIELQRQQQAAEAEATAAD